MKNSIIGAVVALITAATLVASVAYADTRPPSDRPIAQMLQRPHLERYNEPDLKTGATVTAYKLAWDPSASGDVGKRLHGAIGVLLGEESAARIADRDILDYVIRGEDAGTWTRVSQSPILAKYEPEYDELRLIREELTVIDHPASDVGVRGASDLAEKYLQRLGEAGVIDPLLYEQAAMQLGYKIVGEGAVGKDVQPGRIVEYRITYRPRLNGIEMANAGVRMGILASGELTSLRVGGVTPAGTWREGRLESSARNATRRIRVGTDDLMKRFYGQVSKGAEAQVAWSRVMYAMPEGKSESVVEPLLLVSYSESRKVGDETVISRRKMLGYSLTDPRAPPIDFDPPADRHQETRVTRKASDQTGGKK